MLDLQKYIGFPKIVVDTVDEKTTSYDLQYLPRGMGHTLGNAFRRIMLAYDMAASVTGMTIRGVTHEYQVLDGIKESVIVIMLNVKKLRFLVEDDEKEYPAPGLIQEMIISILSERYIRYYRTLQVPNNGPNTQTDPVT